MSQFLEAVMLLCFGFSWPINLMNNIKSKSAKGMSLPFILLITFGYIAGISSKILTHQINYVFAVYIFNIIMVALNIFVFFYNTNLDKKKTAVIQQRSFA